MTYQKENFEKILSNIAPLILAIVMLIMIFVAVLNHQSQMYVTKEEYCQMIRLSLKPKFLPRDQIKLCYEELNREYKPKK